MANEEERLGLGVSNYSSDNSAVGLLEQLGSWLKEKFNENDKRSFQIIEKTKRQRERLNKTLDRINELEGM